MTTPPETAAVEAQQVEAAQVAAATAMAVVSEWESVDEENIAESWMARLARVLAVVAGGQQAVASRTDPYLDRLLPGERDARLLPEAFSGVAPDGRPLLNLLMYPVWVALRALTAGVPVARGMAQGAAFADLLARTVVADTSRAALQAAMVADTRVTSYIRVVEVPACDRCIVLAGREYSVTSGFLRHPRCDCSMAPVTRSFRPAPSSPGKLFEAMSPAQRRQAFGEAGAQAIGDGADIEQVVNARRGMKTVTAYGRKVQATSEGVTRRGLAGQRLRNFEQRRRPGQRYRTSRTPRLMPAEIYRLADDRAQAVRLLRNHGYIL